nr:uncharacterized protein LOC127339969 [Lolium perenne]
MQAALQHEQALKDARVAAEARLAEVVEDSTNSNTVLTAELEEERKARKAAERLIDTMTTDHREYDRLVMKIDALALQHFPDSQAHAVKKVMEDRVAREFPNMDAHWDGYDYLVALSARVQHMRSVDRLLGDLPDASIQLFKVLWPEEEMPEEEEGDEDEAAEDVPPEAPEASAAPPEDTETGAAPPDAPVA